MIAYKCLMKSFLTVQSFTMPIENVEDILTMPVDVIVYEDSFMEEVLQQSPEGSVYRRIYDEKIVNYPGIVELGYEEAVSRIISGNAVFYGGVIDFALHDEYPCFVTDVKTIRYSTNRIF